MAWETRNGQRYYYRKRREGKRVVSEYQGRAEVAELSAQCDAYARQRREAERAEAEALDRMLAELSSLLRLLTHATLIANGYHTHKGQWRRKRDSRATKHTQKGE